MAIAMTSPAPFFRNFSNKENSTFASSPILQPAFTTTPSGPSSHKHRVGGIGRAPKRSQHNAKPYDRKTSIARAKSRATSPAKGEAKSKSTVGRKTRRSAPTPILTTAPLSLSRITLEPPRPRVRIANIPVRLPRPRIPPVHALPGQMSHIPIEWALPRLRTQFPALLTVSSQYRPQPQFTQVTDPSSSSQSTFAFAIPQLLSDDEGSVELEAKVKGREPDVCLAIKGRGQEAGVARLLPVNSLVYASQCSFWPQFEATSPSPEASNSALPVISEEHESGSDSDATITSAPRSLPSSSSESGSESDSPFIPAPSRVLHLPLLPITIPHPASLPTLHTHLHLPTRSLLPALLALPPTCTTPELAGAELAQLGLHDLMQKLEHMHGFWSNLCALGVHGEASWRGLGEAWGLVVGVVASRSRRVGEMAEAE